MKAYGLPNVHSAQLQSHLRFKWFLALIYFRIKKKIRESRASSMEEVWRAHVGKLTLQQLQSPEACRAHLDSFPRSIVSEGLELTPVANSDDVHGVITTFLQSSPDFLISPAASMKMLSDMEREFHIGVMLKEVGQIVKAAAEKGRRQTQYWMDPGEYGNVACEVLESRRSFTSDRDWLDTLFALLRRQGYTVEEEEKKSWQQGYTGKFRVFW